MSLNLIANITLDMLHPYASSTIVQVNQYDTAGSIKATLLNDGVSWNVPQGAKAVVMFKKTDNIGGFYDVTELNPESAAVTVDSNDRSIIYITLDQQTTTTATTAGQYVNMQVAFYQNGARLSTFAFYMQVQPSVVTSGDIHSNWLFNILSQEIAQVITDATTPERLTEWLEANITQETGYVIDNTLTVAQAAADAQATGKMVTVSDTNPGVTANKVWVKKTPSEIVVPTEDEVEDLRNTLNNRTYHDFEPIEWIPNGSIVIGDANPGDIISMIPEQNSNWEHAIVECEPGAEFLITGTGGSNPRLYAILDFENKLIVKSNQGDVRSNYYIVTPQNCSKVIINNNISVNKNAQSLYKAKRNDAPATFHGFEKVQTNRGQTINCNVNPGTTVDLTPSISTITIHEWESAVVECTHGDAFYLDSEGSTNPLTYCFLDSENRRLAYQGTNARIKGVIVAPLNTAKVVLNNRFREYPNGIYYLKLGRIEELKNKVIKIEEFGTKSMVLPKISAVGQFYFHTGERCFKRIVTYTGNDFTDETIPYDFNNLVLYNGLLGFITKDGVFQEQQRQQQANFVYICGYGDKAAGGTNLTGVGQYYIHSGEGKLKRCTSFIDITNFTDETLDFDTGTIYVFWTGDWYYYSGSGNYSGLVKLKSKDEYATLQNVDSYTYQLKNIIDYLGVSNFYERVLTLQEANAYVSWPVVASNGDELVCVYARGDSHVDNHSGAYYKTSPDGIVWSSEKKLLDTSSMRENATGKGYDANGKILYWIRVGTDFILYRYDGNAFTVVTNVNMGVFAHVGDIIKANNDVLISFWNDYATSRSYGILKSVNNGATWEKITFTAESSNTETPTEIQGVYLGNGRILAIGRKDTWGGTNAQMQFQSTDNGETWTKEYTNITDISASTASLIYDSSTDKIYMYYYNRGTGKLLCRVNTAESVWNNPTGWNASEVIATGGVGQDAGNANAVSFGNLNCVSYYSGNSAKTGVFDVLKPRT